MSGKQNASHNHHWFPAALSGYWTDAEGKLYRRTKEGKPSRAMASTFGRRENWHLINFGKSSPWTSNYEAKFQEVDGRIKPLVGALFELTCVEPSSAKIFYHRLQRQVFTNNSHARLVSVLASLLARLPSTRRRVKRLIQSNGCSQNTDAEIESVNLPSTVSPLMAAYTSTLSSRTTFLVMFSDSRELVYGDGLFHTLPIVAHTMSGAAMGVVPLTPSMAILFYRSPLLIQQPNLLTIRLDPQEALHVNRAVQENSHELFYRSEHPLAYTPAQFSETEFWFGALFDSVASYA